MTTRSAAPAVPAIAITGLAKRFGGVQALSDVSLEVKPGERHVILGPNGAGKTTLFNVICGEERPTTGSIVLLGRDITRLRPYQRAALGLARTYQVTSLFPTRTVAQNVMLAVQGHDPAKYRLHRSLRRYDRLRDRMEAVLDDWGLRDKSDDIVAELSHGDQRVVEIALALAQDPRLLLLDEPTSGLSVDETQRVVTALQGLQADVTVLLIEHDMDVAFAVAEQVTVLHRGSVIAQGPSGAVRTHPEVLRIYLGERRV